MTALALPFGAIADARVRQRRRRIVGAAAILLLAAAAGLGAYVLLPRHQSPPKLALIGISYTPGATFTQRQEIAKALARNNPFNPDNPNHVRPVPLKEYEKAVRPLILHRPAHDYMPVFRADVAAKERELRLLPGVARFYAVPLELP